MAHEVGGDSAEVKGQDVPIIVGIGSPLGKAFITDGTGWVVATHVVVGFYCLLLVTVSVQGILPLWQEREVRSLCTWPFLSPSTSLSSPALRQGTPASGQRESEERGSCGCASLGSTDRLPFEVTMDTC